MAASRRGHSMRDQWREEADAADTARSDRRVEEHRRRSPRAEEERKRGHSTLELADDIGEPSSRGKRPKKSEHRRPRSLVREKERHTRATEELPQDRRGRESEIPQSRHHRQRSVSFDRERKRHSREYPKEYRREYERGREPREHSPGTYSRHHSPYSSRRDQRYSDSWEDYYNRGEYHPRESHHSAAHYRRRSRSPHNTEHHRAPSSQDPLSSARYSRHRDDDYYREREDKKPYFKRVEDLQPVIANSPATSEKVSKSSKRSERQRNRTRAHLQARTKAKKFLDNLEVPSTESADEEQSMQQSTRHIPSVLDDQSRQASPPRPIPAFDNDSSGPAPMREPYPAESLRHHEMHSSHRRALPHVDTRYPYNNSPQYAASNSSHHGSPPNSASPYSQGRGGWGGHSNYGGPG